MEDTAPAVAEEESHAVFDRAMLLRCQPKKQGAPAPDESTWTTLTATTALARIGIVAQTPPSIAMTPPSVAMDAAPLVAAPWRRKKGEKGSNGASPSFSPETSPQIGPKSPESPAPGLEPLEKHEQYPDYKLVEEPFAAVSWASATASPAIGFIGAEGTENPNAADNLVNEASKPWEVGASSDKTNAPALSDAPALSEWQGPFADDCAAYTRSVMQAAMALHMGGAPSNKGGGAKGKGGGGKGQQSWKGGGGEAWKGGGGEGRGGAKGGSGARDVDLPSERSVGPTPPPAIFSLAGEWQDSLGNKVQVAPESTNAWITATSGGQKEVQMSVDQWGRLWCGNGVLCKVGYCSNADPALADRPSHLAWRTTSWKISTWERVAF